MQSSARGMLFHVRGWPTKQGDKGSQSDRKPAYATSSLSKPYLTSWLGSWSLDHFQVILCRKMLIEKVISKWDLFADVTATQTGQNQLASGFVRGGVTGRVRSQPTNVYPVQFFQHHLRQRVGYFPQSRIVNINIYQTNATTIFLRFRQRSECFAILYFVNLGLIIHVQTLHRQKIPI